MPKQAVKVCIRTRPTAAFDENSIQIDVDKATVVVNTAAKQAADSHIPASAVNNAESVYSFNYHHILHNASQDTVFNTLSREVVQSVVDGTNGTIMCYGQTGSGKTFTMIGDTRNFSHRGIAPRSLSHIFNEVNERTEIDFKLSCVYYEIYNEKVYDLLDDLSNSETRTDFQIAEEKNGRGVFVRGLNEVQIDSEQDALNYLYSGELARTTSQHKLNKRSNRSHSIFTIFLQQRARSGVSERIVCSKLNLVDLAGSERLKKTMDDADDLVKIDATTKKESMYINQSLTYLEQCVVALSKKNPGHVPYRQTRLTNVLKDAIGGNCNTLMFANIYGETAHLEETISTLRLAARMMRVQNDTSVVETFDDAALVKKLTKEVKELKQELLMHDAMVERTGIVYDEYTPEQQQAMQEMIEKYCAAEAGSEEEDNALSFQSVRQMREICRQFKKVVGLKDMAVDRAKTAAMAASRGGGGGRLGETTAGGGDDKFAGGNVTFGEDKDAVGDAVNGEGFGLGFAQADSRPGQIDPVGSPSRSVGSLSPSRNNVTYDSSAQSKGGRAERSERGHKGEVPDDKEEAFILYKKTRGSRESASIQSMKSEVKTLKSNARSLGEECNQYKEELDVVQDAINRKRNERMAQLQPGDVGDVDVVDQEEFDLMRKERAAKKGYKTAMGDLQGIKSKIGQLQMSIDDMKYDMLTDFDEWHSLASGTAISNFPAESEVNEDGEIMDDAEMFEKMEKERVYAADPDSVAFFQAQKTRNANMTQNSLAIKQMRKNKRSVGGGN